MPGIQGMFTFYRHRKHWSTGRFCGLVYVISLVVRVGVHCTCSVHVQYMFSTSSENVQYMFSTCSVQGASPSSSLKLSQTQRTESDSETESTKQP